MSFTERPKQQLARTREAIGRDVERAAFRALTGSDITFDGAVRAGDARPLGKPDECFFCKQRMGSAHNDDCVILNERILEATPIGVWQPIDTYRDGDRVLFWFPNGERGNGGMETAMAFRDEDGELRTGWTHGGPNAGSDFSFCEPPTKWCRLPNEPE